MGQVRVLTEGGEGVGNDVVSEEKRGPSIAKMRAEDNVGVAVFRTRSGGVGVSDRPAEGAVSKWERAERLA